MYVRIHHELAETAYNEKRADKEFTAKNKGIFTASFDLLKVSPSPMLQTGIVYYKKLFFKQLWKEIKVWDETIAKRGAIGSCVM